MLTARLPAVNVSAATRCGWGEGHQVNKFEQVSSDGHQMSLGGGQGWGGGPMPDVLGVGSYVWCREEAPMSDVQGSQACRRGDLYSEFQCIMDNAHMGDPSPCAPPSPAC